LLWMNPGASVAASVPMPAPAEFGILWKMNLWNKIVVTSQ
jgi:hypothetical protein